MIWEINSLTNEKHSIFGQARVAGISVAQVTMCYSMNANLIHKWLRDPRFATDLSDDALVIDEVPSFLPVEIGSVASSLGSEPPPALEAPLSAQRVDITLSDGRAYSSGRFDVSTCCFSLN